MRFESHSTSIITDFVFIKLIRKEGAAYDLPLALAILSASKQLRENGLSEYMIRGELSLDGSVQNVRGVLPMALRAKYRTNPHQYP